VVNSTSLPFSSQPLLHHNPSLVLSSQHLRYTLHQHDSTTPLLPIVMDNGKLIKLAVAAANAEKDAYDNYLKNGDRLTLCLPLIAGTLRDFEKYFAKRGELYEGSSACRTFFPIWRRC
jgi:hypothetical protein